MSEIVIESGIHDQVPAEVYHGDPCEQPSLSASVAHALLTLTPAHARLLHRKLTPLVEPEDESRFERGRAVHSLFLEGIDLLAVCDAVNPKGEVCTDWRTNAAKAFRDAARERGKIPVLAHQADELRHTLRSLRRRVDQLEDKPTPFTDGKPEQTLIWQERNGVWCRARPDWLHSDYATIDDLKTCASASPGDTPGSFGRAVEYLGHWIQEAFYRRGVRALCGGRDPVFRFVAVELDGPGISCSSLSEAYRKAGDAAVERAINLWGDCLARNDWPGFPTWRVEIEPPQRLIAREESELCL